MDILRTPEQRFENLPDYPFEPHYVDVPDGQGGRLRMHYLDEGQGEVVLCLHGQPTWSYLYRKMIPPLTRAGYRVIAPDLIGFGRSDKPSSRADYSYANHVLWVKGLLEALDLTGMTLFGQDWGGLIGLRLVAENPQRFARVVAANTGLPDAKDIPDAMAPKLHELMDATPALPLPEMAAKLAGPMGDRPPFMYWVKHCDAYPDFDPAMVVRASLKQCSDAEYAAYAAPFPSEEYLQGARQFPSLVPIIPDNPAVPANRAAWKVFARFDKPFLTAFSDSDPVTRGGEKRFIETVPGAAGQKHAIIGGAGHFLQDDAGGELARIVIEFIRANPV
ncbi:MAG: haloalkane dehalogenase [Pseudomonadales bacterium]